MQKVTPLEEITTEFWTREQAVGLANNLLKQYAVTGTDGHQAEVTHADVENYKEANSFRGIERGQEVVLNTVDGVTMYLEVQAIMRPQKKEVI